MPSGRKSGNVEFLQKLKALSGIDRNKDFAIKCKKQESNITNYLNGNPAPGDGVLRDCVRNIFGWEIEAEREIEKIPQNLATLPTTRGIYVLYDSAANVLYIGQARNLQAEVRQALNRKTPVGMRFGPVLNRPKHPQFRDLATHLSLYEIEDDKLRHNVEALLLRVFVNQTHNRNIGRFR